MNKLKFTFTNILFWVGFLLSILVFENLDFFHNVDGKYLPLDNNTFYLLFIIAAFSYVAMIILDIVLNKHKPNVVALIAFVAVCTCTSIGVWLLKPVSFSGGAPDYVLSFDDKLRQTLTLALFLLTSYGIFSTLVSNHPSIKRLWIVYLGIILVCFGLIVYSIIFETSKYVDIFSGRTPISQLGSLFYNSNMFAGTLLLGTCASIGLDYLKKNPLSLIALVAFMLMQVMICSLTCIILSLIITVGYFFIEIILNFKKRFALALTELCIAVTLVVGTVVLVISSNVYDLGEFSHFTRFLIREISESNYETFSNRTFIWTAAIEASSKDIFTLLFGYGPQNSEYIIGGMTYDGESLLSLKLSCHNGYLQILMNFGLVGVAALTLFIFFYFYSLVRLYKRNKRFCTLFLLVGLAYLGYSVTESIIAFNMSAQGLLIGMFIYLPVMTKYYHYKHQEIGSKVIEQEVPQLLKPELISRMMTRVLLSVIAVGCSFLIFPELIQTNHFKYVLFNIIAALGISLFFYPYLNGLWAKNTTLNKYLIRSMFNSLIIAGAITFTSSMLAVFESSFVSKDYIWITPLALIAIYLIEVLIYSIVKKGTIVLYLNTFVGFKTSLGGLLASAGLLVGAYFLRNIYLHNSSIYVIIGLPLLTVIVFYVFSYITPFKDFREITIFENSFGMSVLKREVVRERLEQKYEAR